MSTDRLGLDYSSHDKGSGKLPEPGRTPAATNVDNFYQGVVQHLPRSAADTAGRPELTPNLPDENYHRNGGRGGEYNS